MRESLSKSAGLFANLSHSVPKSMSCTSPTQLTSQPLKSRMLQSMKKLFG